MAVNSTEIIEYIERNYPQNPQQVSIKNIHDKHWGFENHSINQYILGVCKSDAFSNDITQYKYSMTQKLGNFTKNAVCLPWPFSGDEKDEMEDVLTDLANRWSIITNVKEMVEQLKIPRDDYGTYYIVVTVVQYNIAIVN